MKRINSLYIIAFFLGLILVFLANSMQTKTASFYGFAENKETEINHIDDVLVYKIHVENGQEVKEGDLLIEVQDAVLPSKIDGLKLEKEILQQDVLQKKNAIRNKIAIIEMDRDLKLNEIEAKIKSIEADIAVKQSLYKGLQTIQTESKTTTSPDHLKLEVLKSSKNDVVEKARKEINMEKKILATIDDPSNVKAEIIDTEIKHYQRVKDRLFIYAPSDGLIGNITCKEGENIAAFSTLMNFYKHNPTLVKGYVHESMILEVKVGDALEVSSSLHPDIKIRGEVIGLGSRIVEIPERLRKIPDFKTYGREVLIRIPAQNSFLQKEKVLLNTISKESGLTLGNLFTSKKPSSLKKGEDHIEIKD